MEQCKQAGLVWGKELYIDATKVQANASRDSVKPRFAVEAHLTELFATEANEEPPSSEKIKEPVAMISHSSIFDQFNSVEALNPFTL